jgi:tetratricopeptide (TPR) repeat protein
MKLDPILTKATRLARRGKYGDAINTLLPEVVRYHDSFRYHYIMGVCHLHAGDFTGAREYLKRARDLKMRDPLVLLGMAALFVRRGQTDRALDLYLEVQDLDGGNKTARKALGVLRRYSGSEELADWLDAGKLPRLFPPLPRLPPSWSRVILSAAFLLIAVMLGFGVLLKTGRVSLPEKNLPARAGLSVSVLEQDEKDKPVQIGGTYRYILTRDQVLGAYEEARSLFSERRDEAAKVALNRILESNASEGIKNKARLLISYTEVPGFDTLKDRYRYGEVKGDPALYRDCFVIWRGMATNVQELEQGTLLDFLVGYDTRSSLEGIVPVSFAVSVPVDPERPLEILGKVLPAAGGEIRLEGLAVHQAAR